MAEGGRQLLDWRDVDDYLYSEELYADRLPKNYSCPVCLCPVQRAAHLTQCCGNHYCLACIDRVRSEGKPCPMCNGRPVVIFPNKERQREINQLKVLCPLRDEDEVDGGCDWTGELGQMYSHIVENHTNDSTDKNAEENALAVNFEHCQIEDSRLPRHELNRSTASSSLEILSDDAQGGTNLMSNEVLVLSSSHWVTPIHPAAVGGVILYQSPRIVPIQLQARSHCHHHPHLHLYPHHPPHCYGPRHPHPHGLTGHPHPHPHGPRRTHPHPHSPRPHGHRPGHPHPHHHGHRFPMHPHYHGPTHSHPHRPYRHP